MTLQSSGPIDFGQINVELGLPANTQISLGDTNARSLATISSGSISMNNFYGKQASINSLITNFTAMTNILSNSAACDEIRNDSTKYALFASPNTIYSTVGTFTFIVPAGKTCITALVVGTGGNGGNGIQLSSGTFGGGRIPSIGTRGLSGGYGQGVFSVTSGESITVTIGPICSFKTISIAAGVGKPDQIGKLLKLDGTSPHGYGCYGNGGINGLSASNNNFLFYGGGGGGGGGYSVGGNGTNGNDTWMSHYTGTGGIGGTGAVLLIY